MRNRLVALAVAAVLAFAPVAVAVPAQAKPKAEGVVQAKEKKRGRFGIVKRRLCVGANRESCRWVNLRNGNVGRRVYSRCSIGEAWPKCRKR